MKNDPTDQPARSLLFVPAHEETKVRKAVSTGADIIILDLEDGVPDNQKEAARRTLLRHIETLQSHGMTVWVRPNSMGQGADQDIEALIGAQAISLLLPKIERADSVLAFAGYVIAAGLRPHLSFVPLIETAEAFFKVREIVDAHILVRSLAFGPEDFAASAGLKTETLPLTLPGQSVALAAAAHQLPAYGFVGSLANYADISRFEQEAAHTRDLGFSGALCIHPDQVAVANRVFMPTSEDVVWAQEILNTDSLNSGDNAGLGMIDAPVRKRAEQIIKRIGN